MPGKVDARERLLREINQIDVVCAGTLVRRRKLCGRASCPCATDPGSRHGPYYEWGRVDRGRLGHKMVSALQARRILEGIRNARQLRRLLKQWERACAQEILSAEEDNS